MSFLFAFVSSRPTSHAHACTAFSLLSVHRTPRPVCTVFAPTPARAPSLCSVRLCFLFPEAEARLSNIHQLPDKLARSYSSIEKIAYSSTCLCWGYAHSGMSSTLPEDCRPARTHTRQHRRRARMNTKRTKTHKTQHKRTTRPVLSSRACAAPAWLSGKV